MKSEAELNAMPLSLRLAWINAWAFAAPVQVLNAQLKDAVRSS
jgi:hypothetical protein